MEAGGSPQLHPICEGHWVGLIGDLGSKDSSDEDKSLFGLGSRANGQENGALGCLREVLHKRGESRAVAGWRHAIERFCFVF